MSKKTKNNFKIPLSFQGILWSKEVKRLNPEKDKVYIIHQILNYGDLRQIDWLKKQYGEEELRKVFLKAPQKIYTPASFNFVKNYILRVSKEKVDKKRYYATTLRSAQ